MRVAVLGSGADALAVAADMSRHGHDTALAGLDDDRSNLEPVAARAGIVVSGDPGARTYPVTVADDIARAIEGAHLIAVVVPPGAHAAHAAAVAAHVTADQTVLMVGDGSGAIVARRAIDLPTPVAETNTVPCPARPTGPGEVVILPKPGAVLIAALPATRTGAAHVVDLIADVWPHATATDSVWSTALAGYSAIAKTVTAIAASGTLEDLKGATLWAEGATPEVEIVIETVDNELLALRRALNSREPRGCHDFLPPDADTGARPKSPKLMTEPPAEGPYRHQFRPDAFGLLVLVSSLGAATGVPTPVVDKLVDVGSSMLGRDLRAGGRTLATLGLDGLDTTGLIGFARTGLFP